VRGFCFLDGEITTSQGRGATLPGQHKSDKELPSIAFLFLPIALGITHFSKECPDMGKQGYPYHGTQGYPNLVSIHPRNLYLFSPFLKIKKWQLEVVVSSSHE
jgi:hypothetical protein